MKQKIIFIVIDGLNARVAEQTLGFLFAMQESGQARYCRVQSALPAMSRPLYETLLTGRPPVDSGIVDNSVVRLSNGDNIFALARAHQLTTAAAAYHWVSELYQHCPYDYFTHRFQFDSPRPIQHAIFYHLDNYPDMSVVQDADFLRQRYQPHFLFIHTMNVDDAGHKHGVDSKAYSRAARTIDRILAQRLPLWLTDGYQIIVTADHGMAWDNAHNGTSDDERLVPFFTLGDAFATQALPDFAQTQICALLCQGLGITHPLNNAPDNIWKTHA